MYILDVENLGFLFIIYMCLPLVCVSEWPSGLRRCIQVAVYVSRRGFKSHL